MAINNLIVTGALKLGLIGSIGYVIKTTTMDGNLVPLGAFIGSLVIWRIWNKFFYPLTDIALERQAAEGQRRYESEHPFDE